MRGGCWIHKREEHAPVSENWMWKDPGAAAAGLHSAGCEARPYLLAAAEAGVQRVKDLWGETRGRKAGCGCPADQTGEMAALWAG